MDSFIKNLPKAELHIHFDGALEPTMALTLAEKNKIHLPFSTLETLQKKYHFAVKKDFLLSFSQWHKYCEQQKIFIPSCITISKKHLNKV